MDNKLIQNSNKAYLPLYWRDTFFNQFESSFFVTHGETTKAWWCCDENEILSGFHGPFGGLQRAILPAGLVSVGEVSSNLINLRETFPLSKNEKRLRIRTYPEGIFTNWSVGQELALLEYGFKEEYRDVVHYIEIRGDFKSAWNRNRTREFKKTNQYLDAKEISSEKDQMTVLDLLERDASSKGRRFPIDRTRFNLMRSYLTSEDLNLFICFEKQSGEIVAAAICQVIDSFSVYVYRWGTLPKSKNHLFSPITYLADHLYAFYQNLGIEILYLGSSSVKGIINPGLASFKESLGAKSGSNSVCTIEINKAFG